MLKRLWDMSFSCWYKQYTIQEYDMVYFDRLVSNVSEAPASFIWRAEMLIFYPDDRTCSFLRNPDIHLPFSTASPRTLIIIKNYQKH
jgi:hypothetical protein